MSQITTRQAAQKWDEYAQNLRRETPVPHEDEATKQKRIERLKGNWEEFCKYYFPNYASAPFARFHKQFMRKCIAHDELYIVRAWAREHAKSVVAGLFLPLYLKFTGRLDNMLLVSHNADNAAELLMPIMMNLEHNQRIIADYGPQRTWRSWEQGRFITGDGCSFRSIGAGQSPRGTRNEEKRPDFILIDDIDTDEEARNQARIDRKWAWIEQALFPTMSISGKKRFIVVGNIISKDSCIVKASKVADDYQSINILNSRGKPSWGERYSLEQVNYMLSKISYASGQKEYFNNPLSEGTVFKDITWGKVPPMSRLKFIVAYCDPSYKDSRKNDFKAIPLVGELNGNFYVYNAYLEQTSVAKMIQWFYDHKKFVDDKTTLYMYLECGGLQDAFYEQLFLPKLVEIGKATGEYLSISPDDRHKTDKFTRIEATLEPLNRQGRLIFNEAQRENPHMRRLEEQMKAIEPGLPGHDDGPDALEGAVWIINNKLRVFQINAKPAKKRSSKKY